MLLYRLFILIFFLSGCSLKPIYKKYEQGVDREIINELSRIQIIEEDGYNHHMLRNHLEDLLNPSRGKLEYKYRLTFSVKEESLGSIISNDATIVSYTKKVEVTYRLYDIATSKLIDYGTVIAQNIYDANTSPFANYSSDKDATKRNIVVVADKIKIRIINKMCKNI